MTKARGLADLGNAYSDGALSNRNLIINGAMQVWQRGTSFTVGGSDTYTADRWTSRDGDVSQSTDVPANQGFKYSLFYDNGGTRSTINLRQKIEDGKALLSNREVTLSFWVKSSASTTIKVDWTDTNNTSVSVTTSWKRYEISYPAEAINSGNIFSGSAWIDFNFEGDYPDIHITGVQLEVGDTATPFEHHSYGDTLARCQRYYCNNFNGNAPSTVKAGNAPDNRVSIATLFNSGDLQCAPISFPTTMRVLGSVSYYSPSFISTLNNWGVYGPTNAWSAGLTVSGQYLTKDRIVVSMSGAAGRSNYQSFIVSGYFEVDAEL